MFINLVVDTFHQTYDWAGDVGATLQNRMSRQAQRTQASIAHTYQAMNQGCQQAGHYVGQTYTDTTDKVVLFINQNQDKIYFTGCCLATAYFAPTLFFGSAVVTVIMRVEISYNLSKMADYYLKDDRNPYKLNPFYDNYVSTLDLTMASLGAVDAIALGTLFVAYSPMVALLPALGGIAAGSSAAKWGMNIARFFQSGSAGDELDIG